MPEKKIMAIDKVVKNIHLYRAFKLEPNYACAKNPIESLLNRLQEEKWQFETSLHEGYSVVVAVKTVLEELNPAQGEKE